MYLYTENLQRRNCVNMIQLPMKILVCHLGIPGQGPELGMFIRYIHT